MNALRTITITSLLLALGCDDTAAPSKSADAKPKPAAAVSPKAKPAQDKASAAIEEPKPETPAGDQAEAGDQDEAVEDETPLSDAEAKVAIALKIAEEVEAKPDDLDAILSARETNQAEFSALLYEIAADPEMSVLYAEAREPDQG